MQVPDDLTPVKAKQTNSDKPEGKREKLKKTHKGDKLTVFAYNYNYKSVLIDRNNFEMHFVVSLLSFQRQFAACTTTDKHPDFRGKLLGQQLVNESNNSYGDEAEECLAYDSDNKSHLAFLGLNESQRRAAKSFLSSKDGNISIVQG